MNICTIIEQSKKLLKLGLEPKTSDMCYVREWLASVKNIYIDVAVDGVEAYKTSVDSPKIGRIRWGALIYVYRDGEWYMMAYEDGIGYDYNQLLESHIRHALDYLNGKEGCFQMPISMREKKGE